MNIIKDDGSFVYNVTDYNLATGARWRLIGDEIFIYNIGKHTGILHHRATLLDDDIVFIIEE